MHFKIILQLQGHRIGLFIALFVLRMQSLYGYKLHANFEKM